MIKKLGIIAMGAALVACMGLFGCGSDEPSEPSGAFLEGNASYTYQDADGEYWEAVTEISEDGHSFKIYLPVAGMENWTYSLMVEGEPTIDILPDTENVEEDIWSAVFSGAGIDATGDTQILFTENYPAGEQPVRRMVSVVVNVDDEDLVSVVSVKGVGVPAEWYDAEGGTNFAMQLPIPDEGSWEFQIDDESILEVVAGPADDGDVTAISYRGLASGATTIYVNRLDANGDFLCRAMVSVEVDENMNIVPIDAFWQM